MHRRDLVRTGLAAYAGGYVSLGQWVRELGGPAGSGRRLFPVAGPVPTPQQLAWQDAAMGMFVHFGINTFSDREWGLGNEDPATFDPARFDARQWVRSAQSAGCKYIVLTAKHHDGFCLWPSRQTKHSVASSPWRGGNGDVVRELADAARAAGIGLGLYLSPWDRNAPSYGSGKAYDDFYVGQLTELLTNYGPLTEVWFDGANGEGPNGKKQEYDWPRIHSTVRRLQPNALMFSDSGPDIRWNGNERGIAGDPNWCTVDPSIVTRPGMDGANIIASLQHGEPPPQGSVWRPGEADVSIRPGWFHHPAEDAKVKTADQLMEIWFNSVGRGANLLLNVPPARDGLIADPDVRAMTAFGTAQRNYWAGAIEPRIVGPSATIVDLEVGGTMNVRAVELREAIADGQHVARYHIDARTDGGWRTIVQGTTIGHMKVDRFTPVETPALRLFIDEAIGTPRLLAARIAIV